MTRDELHYLAGHVNDEMFDRIHALREQVKVLSEEKIHADRRINNQRKELKRKDEQIKELEELIERSLELLYDAADMVASAEHEENPFRDHIERIKETMRG